MADKVLGLRVFGDGEGKMNLALQDVGGALLVVSQFTLYGDAEKGRRPSFIDAARPEAAERFYERFIGMLADRGVRVERGEFGAMMRAAARAGDMVARTGGEEFSILLPDTGIDGAQLRECLRSDLGGR